MNILDRIINMKAYLFVNDSTKTNIYSLKSYDKIDRYSYKVFIDKILYSSEGYDEPIYEDDGFICMPQSICVGEQTLIDRIFKEGIV